MQYYPVDDPFGNGGGQVAIPWLHAEYDGKGEERQAKDTRPGGLSGRKAKACARAYP